MSTINKLPVATSISVADRIPIYSGGLVEMASTQAFVDYVKAYDVVTQYESPSASGFTVTVDSLNSVWLLITPVANYAIGTIVLPAIALHKQEILINSTKAISILLVDGNGNNLSGVPGSLAANAYFRLRFDARNRTWYRASSYALNASSYSFADLGNGEIQVTSSTGPVAIFTVGAKTVSISGLPIRTFTQPKRNFNDQFARIAANSWGTSPGGGSVSELGGTAGHADFWVDGTYGYIRCNTTNVSRYATYIDPNVGEQDWTVQFTTDSVPAGAHNSMSAVVSYQTLAGYDNHYRLRLLLHSNGAHPVGAVIEQIVNNVVTELAAEVTVAAAYAAGDWWNVRSKLIDGEGIDEGKITLEMYAWKEGTTEPVTPTLSHTIDTPLFKTGRLGVRCFASASSTNNPIFKFSKLQTTQAVWRNPPVVMHNTWVRLLDDPFTAWDDDIETQLSAWLVDTSDDILATSMKFITDAPAEFAVGGEFDGLQIAGQSGYGPLAADGTRIEGSDWQDYMGIADWTYVISGEHRTFPHGDIDEELNLDCSGFTRMVFGFTHGVPMVYSNPAFFDGLNLPRASKNMGPFGPGIVVTSTYLPNEASTTPADYTKLRFGDVVYFDKTVGGTEVEGQIDHVGFVIGWDVNTGLLLFISSRKTVNGPTFAELGGSSGLNNPNGATGGRNYAQQFRHGQRI